MSVQRLWLVLAGVAGVALALQLAWSPGEAPRPGTSWDTAPSGHAGLFELLERFEATHGRWLTGLEMPAADESLWLIAPSSLCETASTSSLERAATPGGPSDGDHDRGDPGEHRAPARSAFERLGLPWIEAGGTAVVWLPPPPPIRPPASPRSPHPPDAMRVGWEESLREGRATRREGRSERCEVIAGLRLPPRRRVESEQGRQVGRVVGSAIGSDEKRRRLPGPTLAFFDRNAAAAPLDWDPLWVASDDRAPFALERRLGAGRLVVVADVRVLTNARLAAADAAPFVFDWVETHGVPWIDEHAHGAVPESGAFRYLARSPARAPGLGLLGLGLLALWRGRAWPVRRVEEVDPEAPTLVAFVDSVAHLYTRTRDFERVFERYRALSLERIRRALGLAPGTPAEIVVAALRAREPGWPALRETGLGDLLTRTASIPDAEALVRAAGRLDALVETIRAGPDRARPGVRRGQAGPGRPGR